MKKKIRIAAVLAVLFALVLSCAAGCVSQPDQTQPSSSVPDASTPAGPTTPGIVIRPTEPPETLPPVDEVTATTDFPEAFAITTYLNLFNEQDAAAFAENLTGEQAVRALTAAGLSSCSIGSDATTVTGTVFLREVLRLLGYSITDDAQVNTQAEKLFLTRGFWQFDAEASLTVEQAANILLSALQTYTVDSVGKSTGNVLATSLGVAHQVLTEYEEPFNRPGSTWVSASTGEAVTDAFTAIPIAVFGTTTSYCDLLCAIGFGLDDPDYDQHTPKYMRLCVDGGQLSEKFYKHHNGDESDPHSGCKNDFTGGQDATLEIFAIDDYEFRMVIMNTFLAVSDPYTGLTIYGFERAEYGPYVDSSRPDTGVYIAHHYWNAYGMGSGYEIVGPATVIKGALTSGNITSTTIDGVEYENGQSYGFGKKLTTAPANAGKTFWFFLDRYGYMLGCSQEDIG